MVRLRSLAVLLCTALAAAAQSPPLPSQSIDTYIHQSWDTLQRSMTDCTSLIDPKLAPFGWAPTNWLAVDGLARYGYTEDADRIAGKFMATVENGFRHDGTIREKYNMDSGSSDVNVTTGYKTNVVGFGWTNGVYREMEQLLASKSAAAD